MPKGKITVVLGIFLFVLIFMLGCGGSPEFSNSGQKNDPLKMTFEIQTKPNQCRIIVSDFNNENNVVYEGLSESESRSDSNSESPESDYGISKFSLLSEDYKINISKDGYESKNRYAYSKYSHDIKFSIDLTQKDEPEE